MYASSFNEYFYCVTYFTLITVKTQAETSLVTLKCHLCSPEALFPQIFEIKEKVSTNQKA